MTAKTVSRSATLRMAKASLEAKKKLDLQQIYMPSRPDGYPELPDDPTELPDSALMSLMTQFTRWSEYLAAQVAVAEVDESSAELLVDKVRVIKGIDMRTVKGKEAASNDEEFWAAREELAEKSAYRKLVAVRFGDAERSSSLLSRELTRRVNRSSREGRVDRWQE